MFPEGSLGVILVKPLTKHFGNVPLTFWEPLGNDPEMSVKGFTKKLPPENLQGTFSKGSFNFSFKEHSLSRQ